MEYNDRIKELEAEIKRLKSEIERAKQDKSELEESRKAMLYMLEDLNKAAASTERAKREWERTFDAILDPIFIHDKQFNIIRANKAYAEAAGMPYNNFIGKPYYDVFPKMDGPFKMCKKALELQEEEEIFIPYTDKIYKARFYPVKDIEGKYLYSVHVMEDITEAKKSEEALKASQEYANNVINSSLDMIIAVDNERTITVFNKAAQEIFGYSTDEILGRHIDVLYANPDEGLKAHKMTIEHGMYVQEILNKRKNGETFPSLLSASILNDLQGNIVGVMGVSHDITNRKLAEKRIKDEMEITSHLLMIAEATGHTIDIDKLMEQVMFCGHEIARCNVCLSYLWDSETNVFKPCRAYGLEHGLVPMFMTEDLDEKTGFVREAMEEKEPIVISPHPNPLPQGEREHDASPPLMGGEKGEGESLFSWIPGVNTIAVIPLIGKKGYLGLIVGIYLDQKPLFTERDKEIMEGIMHQVSTALDQAKLYKDSIDKAMELSHKIETIKVMHEIDRNILSTLNPDELLETAVRMTGKVISCERATVAIVDKEKQGFTWKAGVGTAFLPKIGFAAFKDTSAAEVIKTGVPEYCANLMDVKEPLLVEAGLIKEGFLSHIRAPLTAKGEIIGILTVGSKRASAFTPEDLATLEKIASQISVALENSRLLKDLEDLFFGVIKTLSSAIDAKSPWTAGHSDRVTEYAVEIGKKVGLSQKELKDLELAGLLHDIGKIGTYEYIMDKPEKLTDEELKIMRQHPGNSAKILFPIKQFKDIIPGIRHHHEFYDGTGYPDGLKGEEIPLFARILTIADTFDAMKAERPYRKGRTMDEIILEFKRCSGTQFDPKMAEVFLRMLEKEKFQ